MERKILIDNIFSNNDTIIVDFYNVYCNFVQFNLHKTFTMKSWIECFNILINKLSNCKKIIIISKEIYETDGHSVILNEIKKFPELDIEYIIISNKFKTPIINRERDDFYIIYTYLTFVKNESVFIISNDQYRNFNEIINNIKPIIITKITKNNLIQTVDYNTVLMQKNIKNMNSNNKKLNRISFDFTN